MGLILIIIVVVFLVALLGSNSFLRPDQVRYLDYGGPQESPLDILKKRYARGEISREDFLERKQILNS